MAIKGGYIGKILRVDLTTGTSSVENLPDESVLRKYVGGFGLGMWYLMRMLPPGVAPLDPENPLIFMTGPFTGTRVPAATNCTITTLNANTEFTAGRSHTHGWFGPYMKMAGYDGIIITGASPKWVYLWVEDDKVELRDATKLLGKDTHETEDLIKQELGFPIQVGKGVSVAAIGPAGENLCHGGMLENDKNHSFSHSGTGQIAGSKRLKAIAIRGTGKIEVLDKEKLGSINKAWLKNLQNCGVHNLVKGGGVPKDSYAGIRYVLGIGFKNWQSNTNDNWLKNASEQKVTPKPCYQCAIGCSYDLEVLEGPYKGYVATLSGGGEGIEGISSMVGVEGAENTGASFFLADLNDRMGVEVSSIGCAMSVAFEAYEKGLLTKEDTDGLELKWGDINTIVTLHNRIVHREGRFANQLADGPKAAGDRVGLPDATIHIKGSGMDIHDWRRAWGILFGQAIGGGSGWPSPGADAFGSEPDAGYTVAAHPMKPVEKGIEVGKSGILKMWNDCHGTCWFSTWGLEGCLKFHCDALSAIVGWDDVTSDDLWNVGLRILALERIFNLQRGLIPVDDYKLTPRMMTVPADAVKGAGLSIAPYIEGWTRDYYQTLGWDRKMGKPLRGTLKKLDIEEYADLLWSGRV